jgi:hypothetical protein
LESAVDAETRGDAAAADAYREQADALRAQLAVTPARMPFDRIAHAVMAKRAALELVASLLPPFEEQALADRARELLNLIERLRESGESVAAASSRY